MGFMNINLSGTSFSDYKLTDVGSSAYQLEHDWFTKEDLEIWTDVGKTGTQLAEGIDYELSEEDEDLSFRVSQTIGETRTVYHKITIINATYQTGDLYHSGKYIADTVDADDINNLANHAGLTAAGTHGSTVSATANKLIHRDASGRAKVVAPLVAADIAIKSTVDVVQTNLNTHAALTAAGTHGSTAAATANKLVHRDASGRAQIVSPSVAADIANKGYVDGVAGGAALFPVGCGDAPDITLSGGTRTQHIIYCNNFTVSENTILKANLVICEGDFTIESGKVLTVSPTLQRDDVYYNGYTSPTDPEVVPIYSGKGGRYLGNYGSGGGGAWGGYAGNLNGANGGQGGGSLCCWGKHSLTTKGGEPRLKSPAFSFGGDGGGSSHTASGGGGAGPGAGGGSGYSGGAGGAGGGCLFIICKGNFVNNGTINCNGGNGGTTSGRGGGGGGGGVIVIVAYGSSYTGGTINCKGGNGGSTTYDGGGGGGGHIEIYAKTTSFGTLSVAGGSGPGSAYNGGTGTIQTINISSAVHEYLGGENGDLMAGFVFNFMPGIKGVL